MTTATVEKVTESIGVRKERASHLRWIALGNLVPSPKAQREFKHAWANELAANFHLEGMGYPVVSHRDGTFYVIDGQHRIAALRILGFAPEDTIQCEVYDGLTEAEDAEYFLERNHSKSVARLDQFRVALAAGRSLETNIDRVVRAQGLHIGPHRRGQSNSGIAAVEVLKKVVDRQGFNGLGQVLRIIRDAYGDAGFDALVINGVSVFMHRYNGQVDEAAVIERLSKTNGGLNGLLQPAEKTHVQLGQPRAQCIAATMQIIYNRDQRGKKLAPWWKD